MSSLKLFCRCRFFLVLLTHTEVLGPVETVSASEVVSSVQGTSSEGPLNQRTAEIDIAPSSLSFQTLLGRYRVWFDYIG